MRPGLIFALLLSMLMASLVVAPGLPLGTAQAYAQDAERTTPPLPRPRPNRESPLPADPTARPAADARTPATEAITALTNAPQSVTLSAKITEAGEPIPGGLVWRIFGATPDAAGELKLIAKSDEGTANFELVPGIYVVHLAYGRAQISENLTIVPGKNEKSFVLEAGALRLNAAVTGDISVPPNLIKFDIFTAGDDSTHIPVAEGLQPNEIVTLNAGTYHIVSYFGTVNAVVRADLRVEPGQLTDATLYHHASQVSFKLVSESGGEAIADVEWTVKSADGNTIFTDLGAFPTTVLAEGDYLVLAKQGDTVFNREFQVQPGAAREVEVLTTVY